MGCVVSVVLCTSRLERGALGTAIPYRTGRLVILLLAMRRRVSDRRTAFSDSLSRQLGD